MTAVRKMQACVLHGIRDLRVEQVDLPEAGADQVLVRIHAAGICGSDVERVFTKGTYHYPTIIGHEFAGEVVDTGAGAEEWKGKRVSVFPLIPCMECEQCRSGNYAQCDHYNYYGSRCDGGFAEYLAVNTWNLLELPDSISYREAAMFEPAAVAVSALEQAGSLLGKSVVIFGIGAIGLMIAQAARVCGCRSIVLVCRNQEKKAFAQQLGFVEVVNSTEEEAQKRLRDMLGAGADVAIEGCGTSETLAMAIHETAPFGTVVCLGNPKGDICLPRGIYWEILRKQLVLKGTWNSTFKVNQNSWETVRQLVENKTVDLDALITGTYHFEDAQKAFDDIFYRKNGHVHIKSMFIN